MVIPVVDEPVELFRDVLARIVQQRPTEVLVVINGPRNPDLEAVCSDFPLVQWEWTPVAGKRNAFKSALAGGSFANGLMPSSGSPVQLNVAPSGSS